MSLSAPFVFVLMPFKSDFDDIYKLGIKQAAEACGLRAERVDEQFYQERMLERIYQQIEAADIIVADMTGQNASVFYEVGYAHAKNKLCLLLTQDASDIPFDLKHHKHIVYGGSITTLKSQLEANLQWAAQQVSDSKTSGLLVKCTTPTGDLELTEWTATAVLRFIIDVHNPTAKSFGEIEAINFLCGEGWTLSQNGQTCPKTTTNEAGFKERHLLTSPMRTLNPNGWFQIVFVGKKRMASKYMGEEIRAAYQLKGRAMARIATSSKHFDFPLVLDAEVDDMPF